MAEYDPDKFFGQKPKRVTGERETLERIFSIMRRLLLVQFDGDPIPRKGTTRKECYRALWEIQELLETRRYFVEMNLPQTNADRIRQMSDEEMAEWIANMVYPECQCCPADCEGWETDECKTRLTKWLRSPVEVEE